MPVDINRNARLTATQLNPIVSFDDKTAILASNGGWNWIGVAPGHGVQHEAEHNGPFRVGTFKPKRNRLSDTFGGEGNKTTRNNAGQPKGTDGHTRSPVWINGLKLTYGNAIGSCRQCGHGASQQIL